MVKALSPIAERRSHCFSPIEELSVTECQRLASAAVTDSLLQRVADTGVI